MVKNLKTKNMKAILMITVLAGSLTFSQSSISNASAYTTAASTSATTDQSQDTPPGTPPGGSSGSGGFNVDNGSSVQTTGVLLVDGTTETKDSLNLTSTVSNESTIKVTNGGNLTVTNSTLNKTGGEMTVEEASDFFGANAGVLANSGSALTIEDTTINTTVSGGNAIFATGEGTVINVKDVTITTTGDHSRGLDATYTATINADNVQISTAGAHCAALATDRGEGTVTVTNSTLNTSGQGSPCIYSTGDISVTDSQGTAAGSSIAVVEGKNSISIENSTLSAAGVGRTTAGVDSTGVMLYQSMSGDANSGTASFTSENCSLEILSDSETFTTAPMFFVTNTDAEINLINTTFTYGSGILLSIAGNNGEWGTTGSNGGNVTLTMDEQNAEGAINVDAISTLDIVMQNGSELTSTINGDNTAKEITVSLSKDSIWNVTGTSYVTAITDANTKLSNIRSNGNTIYYDASNSANSWLNGATISLSGGGTLTPAE